MSQGKRYAAYTALAHAREIQRELSAYCQRIEIAGSLRRQCDDVGDIELVLIPKNEVFAEYAIKDYCYNNGQVIKDGNKQKKFILKGYGIPVELFITTPEKWGCILMIRTGSEEFARKMVTRKFQGGYCPSNMRFSEGRLYRNDKLVNTPEEDDVFMELGLDYVFPAERSI